MELNAAERADPTVLARHLADYEALRNSIDLTGDAEDVALSNDEETRIALARIDVANAIEWTEQAVEAEAVFNVVWTAEEEEARVMNQ